MNPRRLRAVLSGVGIRISSDFRVAGLGSASHTASAREDRLRFGILEPTSDPALRPYPIEAPTASILASLESGPRAADELGPALETVAALVLDRVLEARLDGQYVNGGAAAAHLVEPDDDTAPTRLGQLSQNAVRLAAFNRTGDERELARMMYRYNTAPVPRTGRLDRHSLARDVVGLEDPEVRRLLHATWTGGIADERIETWRGWSLPGGERAQYKLYISPQVEALRDAFRATLREVADHPPPALKIGASGYNLLRPDKFVIYFGDQAHLRSTTERLIPALAGLSPQGVPFTAEMMSNGLISWGVDPPSAATPESWRLWVIGRLARTLRSTCADACPIDPWRFALVRLGLDGVDVDSWQFVGDRLLLSSPW